MKCQSLFSEKKSKQLINISSTEYAHTVVKVCSRVFEYNTGINKKYKITNP